MKQTEIGLIPDDWEVKEFNQVATLINGRAYSQSELLKQGKYKVLRVGNFGTNDTWYYSNLELPEKQYCNKGDLLYCWSCTYGAYIWNEDDTIYHYHIWKIQTNNADKYYLKYILNNDIASQMSNSNGSTMAHITKGFLEKRRFVFPPFEEQQRIAKALSDVDALIFTTEKLLQKKRNIKQGSMQELLTGKKRLPGFGPQTKFPAYKQTELGLIPEDWEVKSLGEICVINPASSNIIPDEFFYVDLESVSSGKLGKKQKIRRRNAPSRAQRQFEKNDILYQTVRPYQRNNLFVNFDSKNYIASTGYAIIRSNNNVDSHYIYQIIHLNNFVNIILDNCTGTSYPAINPKFLKTIPVIIPKKEEQAAIANVLSSMDKEIETLNTKLEKYRNLKNAMMQQLLTGKIRL